jgi:hypothetical protein
MRRGITMDQKEQMLQVNILGSAANGAGSRSSHRQKGEKRRQER